jgi:anti-anti-sigma factor
VLEDIYPVQWAGQQVVLELPEHIDESSAGQIQDELLSVINRGAKTLIADMTATISCDHAGADAVARAFPQAVLSGTELRLVVTAQIVRRVLSLSGVDRLVSIYPSLEAATAASALAAAVLAARPAQTGTDGQALPHRSGRASRPVQAAGPADGNGAAVTPTMARNLADAFQDGVALADADGKIALASTPLEHMFGYEHAEMRGHPVESLIPAHLQAAYRSHRACYAQAPAARPMGAGARLAGLRKDGTTFPAKISLSPVTTPAGHFTLTVIRDLTAAQQLQDLTGLVRAAVTAEHEHHSRELPDTVITRLFRVALSLQATTGLPAEETGQRIAEALGHLDDTIREIRDTVFTTRSHNPPRHPAPLNDAG